MNAMIRETIGFRAIIAPQNATGAINGDAVLMNERRRACALVLVGAITGTGTVIAKLQSSADGNTWADVPSKSVTLSANEQAAIEIEAAQLPDAHNRIRVRIELGTGVTAAAVSGMVLVGDERYLPVTQPVSVKTA